MPTSTPFTHLHVHSHFSLLRASIRIPELARRTRELGMPGVALTDTANLFGAILFYEGVRKAGLVPILGMEAYVAPGHRTERGRPGARGSELVLLARDLTGWRNLLQLSTIGYLEGFYYRPRIDWESLEKHATGLIALSGGLNGQIGRLLAHDEDDKARDLARRHADLFGAGNFFLELSDQGLPQQTKVNEKSVALGRDLGIPYVATNNVHYLRQEDARAHDVLLCIGQGKLRSDEKRARLYGDQYYLKSPAEMVELFGHWPEALHATEEIRHRCEVRLDLSSRHIPRYQPPGGQTTEAHLRQRCRAGLEARYGDPLPAEVLERAEMELGVIERMGFTDYFLVVADFIDHARQIGVPVGPGRGSAAGSIVSYSLGITDLDPLHYGLLFERFLNEGRNEMPDIDIDFETAGRGKIIEYVAERYGRDNVAQIATIGSMKARAAIRDVGRVLDIPLPQVDAIAKMIPERLGITLADALEAEPDLRKAIDENEQTRELFDIARQIEGLNRNLGIHAGGVIIADQPLVEIAPLCRSREGIACQFDMIACERVGLLKMDLLGLSTLTLIQEAERNIQESRGEEVDVSRVPLDDAATYALLSRGEARGTFQFESSGMRQLLIKMRPDRFEDLVAMNGLFRPGPLQSGMVDKYLDVKHGRDKPSYIHPSLEPILAETYGVILYQEQVMRIASDLAGFPLTDADRLRKAMGKKKAEIMREFAAAFVDGATSRGIPEGAAREIFQQMEFFAGYGFNKSHSAAYALTAYRTAYLKANYPAEFMAALLTVESQKTEKVVAYIEECRRMGLEILPPSILASRAHFTVQDGAIRYGLGAVRGVGGKAVESIAACRDEGGPFPSLHDLCDRVDLRLVNKAVLETLIAAGAFDELDPHRAALLEELEHAMVAGNRAQEDRRKGQASLFGSLATAAPPPRTRRVAEWSSKERLDREKVALGFYLSGHPLEQHRRLLESFASHRTDTAASLPGGHPVVVGGLVTAVQHRIIQKPGRNQGKKLCKFMLEDLVGQIGVVCFPREFDKLRDRLVDDQCGFVQGAISAGGSEPEVILEDFIPVEEALQRLTGQVVVDLDVSGGGDAGETLEALAATARRRPGRTPLLVCLLTPDGFRVTVRAGEDFLVAPGPELEEDLAQVAGRKRVLFTR